MRTRLLRTPAALSGPGNSPPGLTLLRVVGIGGYAKMRDVSPAQAGGTKPYRWMDRDLTSQQD